jgi:hypothetical protein
MVNKNKILVFVLLVGRIASTGIQAFPEKELSEAQHQDFRTAWQIVGIPLGGVRPKELTGGVTVLLSTCRNFLPEPQTEFGKKEKATLPRIMVYLSKEMRLNPALSKGVDLSLRKVFMFDGLPIYSTNEDLSDEQLKKKIRDTMLPGIGYPKKYLEFRPSQDGRIAVTLQYPLFEGLKRAVRSDLASYDQYAYRSYDQYAYRENPKFGIKNERTIVTTFSDGTKMRYACTCLGGYTPEDLPNLINKVMAVAGNPELTVAFRFPKTANGALTDGLFPEQIVRITFHSSRATPAAIPSIATTPRDMERSDSVPELTPVIASASSQSTPSGSSSSSIHTASGEATARPKSALRSRQRSTSRVSFGDSETSEYEAGGELRSYSDRPRSPRPRRIPGSPRLPSPSSSSSEEITQQNPNFDLSKLD